MYLKIAREMPAPGNAVGGRGEGGWCCLPYFVLCIRPVPEPSEPDQSRLFYIFDFHPPEYCELQDHGESPAKIEEMSFFFVVSVTEMLYFGMIKGRQKTDRFHNYNLASGIDRRGFGTTFQTTISYKLVYLWKKCH